MAEQVLQLTPSGEVAEFLDDDQFGAGQSVDKCGPEAVSIVWHSVKPGEHNPYTSAEVHAMAHSDYVTFIGPDTPADQGGTSNQLLYKMLSSHGFHYFFEAPTPTVEWVKGWLHEGYIVILGIYEKSVDDLETGGGPYSWEPGELTHVIVASGPGTEEFLLCRDTANIGPEGVRPGPRKYNAKKLELTSATMVVPSWLPVPTSANPPTPAPAPLPPKPVEPPVPLPPAPVEPPAPVVDYKAEALQSLSQVGTLLDQAVAAINKL